VQERSLDIGPPRRSPLSVPCADWNSCQAGHTHNYWQMPDEPIHLEQLDGDWRLRADLMTYLDSLFIEQLGNCWASCPSPAGWR
jgi:hypothetical protein